MRSRHSIARSSARIAVVALATAALAAVPASPARAVPAQSVAAFTAWSQSKPVLRGLKKSIDEMSARPAYNLTMSDHGIAWTFDAIVSAGTIAREALTVGSDGTATGDAIRHDGSGYGYTFWKSLYGSAVAADFRSSHAVFATRDSVNHTATTYYRGARFGYVSAGGLTIETPTEFAEDLAQARTCAAHPDRCPGD
jgi:hypothetical protein